MTRITLIFRDTYSLGESLHIFVLRVPTIPSILSAVIRVIVYNVGLTSSTHYLREYIDSMYNVLILCSPNRSVYTFFILIFTVRALLWWLHDTLRWYRATLLPFKFSEWVGRWMMPCEIRNVSAALPLASRPKL